MKTFTTGTIHDTIPADFTKVLAANDGLAKIWESLTPLMRNEWICWLTAPKKQATRDEHVRRAEEELREGKRRPCCWIGCIHRTDKEASPSVQGILRKRAPSQK